MSFSAKFKNRREAGQFLARRLRPLAPSENAIVLALPRGGVPVGAEIARELDLPLDVFIVRKLGLPGQEELAIGAIASGGIIILNDDIIQRQDVPVGVINRIAAEETAELLRREQAYRHGREPMQLAGRVVVIVDDGLATGASMRAAVGAVRTKHPASIIVAVPVGAAETCQRLQAEADEVVCGRSPEPFEAVGQWYEDFHQVTDDEVRELLEAFSPAQLSLQKGRS